MVDYAYDTRGRITFSARHLSLVTNPRILGDLSATQRAKINSNYPAESRGTQYVKNPLNYLGHGSRSVCTWWLINASRARAFRTREYLRGKDMAWEARRRHTTLAPRPFFSIGLQSRIRIIISKVFRRDVWMNRSDVSLAASSQAGQSSSSRIFSHRSGRFRMYAENFRASGHDFINVTISSIAWEWKLSQMEFPRGAHILHYRSSSFYSAYFDKLQLKARGENTISPLISHYRSRICSINPHTSSRLSAERQLGRFAYHLDNVIEGCMILSSDSRCSSQIRLTNSHIFNRLSAEYRFDRLHIIRTTRLYVNEEILHRDSNINGTYITLKISPIEIFNCSYFSPLEPFHRISYTEKRWDVCFSFLLRLMQIFL